MRYHPNLIYRRKWPERAIKTSPPMLDEPPETTSAMPTSVPTPATALTAARPILHTDDEVSNLILVKLMLERLGYTVISAASSWDALTICQTQPLSLVISDISKPKMSGFDLLEQLRSDSATKSLTFAFLTTR